MRGIHRTVTRAIMLAALPVALLTTGPGGDALAAGDKGRLRLQLGTTNQFVYESLTTTGYSPSLYQPFGPEGKGSCLITWYTTGVANYAELARLIPGGGLGASQPGFGATSLGVFDGPKGTPCSRVSNYANESLTFALGGDTTRVGGPIEANAFDRLELDIEVKADAALQLVTYVGSGIETGRFHLLTGASITSSAAAPQANGQPVESNLATPVVSCSARSDSGPDSGPSDNCRWVISGIIGQSFTIRPLYGEFSLEGGGDWESTGLSAQRQTFVYLTSLAEGSLTCNGHTQSLSGGGSSTCQVAGAPSGYCPTPNLYYFFRQVAGSANGCEFIKGSGGQLVASMTITFPPEPADLNATRILFPTPSGSYVTYEPKLCTGTVVGLDGNPTIKEVLETTKPAGYVDVIPGTTEADWACILDEVVKSAGTGYIQVYQRILFWGDPLIVRQ